MARSVQLFNDAERKELVYEGVWIGVVENQGFRLKGLEPGSPVGVRLLGDKEFVTMAAADARGDLDRDKSDSVPQRLRIAMRAGESFEVRCRVEGRPFEFVVEMQHRLYTPEQVEAMLTDLGAMDLRWDATSPIPTRVGDLEHRVDRLVAAYPRLSAIAHELFQNPDETLRREQRAVQVRTVRRLGPTMLRRNVVRRNLDASGRPLTKVMIDEVDVPTLDTPANAYAVGLLERIERHRSGLLDQIEIEDRRLANEARRESSYREASTNRGPTEIAAQRLRERLKVLRGRLGGLAAIKLPRAWKAFSSRPDRGANRVRYDRRFGRLTTIGNEILNATSEMARADRLQRIADFGRRPNDEVFEIWSVAKAFQAAYELGFRTPEDPDLEDHREAFVRLEDLSGGRYGLRSGASVALVHKDAPHLFLRIGYEPAIRHGDKLLTPDIMMVLRRYPYGRHIAEFAHVQYGSSPLYLDAKYQSTSMLRSEKARKAVSKYVRSGANADRHPHSYVLQAAQDEFVWSQRRHAGDDEGISLLGYTATPSTVNLFPYRVGVASLVPTAGDVDAMASERSPLTRLIYGWLVAQGVVAICPRCGGGMRQQNAPASKRQDGVVSAYAFKPYLPQPGSVSNRPNPRKRHLECTACDLGLTANYCRDCLAANIFVPIVKLYPRSGTPDEALKPQWVRDYEIAAATDRHQVRHCPRCGSAPDWGAAAIREHDVVPA